MSERFKDFLPPGSEEMGGGRPVQGPRAAQTPIKESPVKEPPEEAVEPGDEPLAGGSADDATASTREKQEKLLTPEGEALDEWLDRQLSTEEHVRKSGTAYAISEHSDRKLRQIKYAIDDLGLYKKRKTGLGNLQELGIDLLYQAVVERRVLSRFDAAVTGEEPR